MKVPSRLTAAVSFAAIGALMALSGCVVHDREVVHDNAGYQRGYDEGYYDREHHRYWHDRAWRDCVENDEHCR